MQVALSLAQMKKALKGATIQFKADQLDGNIPLINLSPQDEKRLIRAKKQQKGLRLYLSKDNFEMRGEGVGDFLKKVGKFYREKVRPVAGPQIKSVVRTLANKGLDLAAATNPFLAPAISAVKDKYLDKAIDKIGLGLALSNPKRGKAVLEDNYYQLLNPDHPGMHPLVLAGPGRYVIEHRTDSSGGSGRQSNSHSAYSPKMLPSISEHMGYKVRGGSFRAI